MKQSTLLKWGNQPVVITIFKKEVVAWGPKKLSIKIHSTKDCSSRKSTRMFWWVLALILSINIFLLLECLGKSIMSDTLNPPWKSFFCLLWQPGVKGFQRSQGSTLSSQGLTIIYKKESGWSSGKRQEFYPSNLGSTPTQAKKDQKNPSVPLMTAKFQSVLKKWL